MGLEVFGRSKFQRFWDAFCGQKLVMQTASQILYISRIWLWRFMPVLWFFFEGLRVWLGAFMSLGFRASTRQVFAPRNALT